MSETQNIQAILDRHRGVIRSTKGGWKIGEGVTSHGYSIMDDLVGRVSFFQVLVLNITGRLPERRDAEWMEATFICLSWPDPRIWCNQIGALGGSSRVSGVASICLGTLASDSAIYGPGTSEPIARFLQRAYRKYSAGRPVASLVKKQAGGGGNLFAPGFSRPIASGDERVAAMQKYASELGFEPGPYESMVLDIQEYLYANYGETLNLAGYIGAFLLDRGYSTDELVRLGSLAVNGGVHACYSEYRDQPPDTFLPLRCEDIEYTGLPERKVPKNIV